MKKVIKLFVLILYIVTCFVLSNTVNVFAAEIEYTDVLYDLEKDSNFDVRNYPSYTLIEIYELLNNDNKDDDINLLEIVSIAEGNNNELFLYVYNPLRKSYNYEALSILMFCSADSNPKSFDPIKYDLELCSTNDVFDKYLVVDFIVSSESEKYYNLIEINRPYIEFLDNELNGGIIEEKAISVNQQWYSYFYNDELLYESCDLKVLELTVTVNSFILFDRGFSFNEYLFSENYMCQCYFIAFECDNYIIKKIFDATLSYYSSPVVYYDYILETDVLKDYYMYEGEPIFENVTLYEDDICTYTRKGLKNREYSWYRILTGSDFKNTVNSQNGEWFVDPGTKVSAEENIHDNNWVFVYTYTGYSEQLIYTSELGQSMLTAVQRSYIKTSNADIFRISFLDENDNYYNLGVVVDATTAKQVNYKIEVPNYDDFFEKILMLLGLLILVLLLVACGPFISVVFNVFGAIFNYVFKFIVSIIKLPIKLFTSNKNKKP